MGGRTERRVRRALAAVTSAVVVAGLGACAAPADHPAQHPDRGAGTQRVGRHDATAPVPDAVVPQPNQLAQTTTRTLPGGRTYELHVPTHAVVPADDPGAGLPLVVVLHPAAHPSGWIEAVSGFTPTADSDGFAVAYPSGISLAWNAGGCCGDEQVDDVAFLRALVDDVAATTPVARDRVYAVGFSNGGMMAYRAVCELPDVFAAAGVVAGTLLDGVDCAGTDIHAYAINGAADLAVPVAGGSGYLGHTFPAQTSIAARVGPGSELVTETWPGGHEYPAWATERLWTWLDARPKSATMRP